MAEYVDGKLVVSEDKYKELTFLAVVIDYLDSEIDTFQKAYGTAEPQIQMAWNVVMEFLEHRKGEATRRYDEQMHALGLEGSEGIDGGS